MKRSQIIIALSAVVLLTSSILASNTFAGDDSEDPATGEEINWQVISSGGENNGTSTSYGLAGTVGQTTGGSGSSVSYGLNHGFWQDFSGEPTVCVPGDAEASGFVDIDDVVYLINYIFGGSPPVQPLCCSDADGSVSVDIDDVVYLINYIFSGGPAPIDMC